MAKLAKGVKAQLETVYSATEPSSRSLIFDPASAEHIVSAEVLDAKLDKYDRQNVAVKTEVSAINKMRLRVIGDAVAVGDIIQVGIIPASDDTKPEYGDYKKGDKRVFAIS